MRPFGLTTLVFALAAALAGCSQDNPLGRKAVSGQVTLDGERLEQGNIEFNPLDGGVQSGGAITGGNYSVPAHQGMTAGKYRVSITDFVPSAPQPAGYLPGDPLPPTPKPKVPPEWNSKSQHTIEVKQAGPFEFNFEINTTKK